MAAVEAELHRRNAANQLVAWLLVNDAANTDTGLSDPVVDFGARATLADILTELQATLTVDGTVDIDPATVALLRDVQAVVTGEVALDAATIADLKVVAATVSGTVSVDNFPATQMDALTDAELRDSPVPVSGTVTADQGAAGATPWPVDISGATIDVGNLQQLAVVEIIDDAAHDLQAAPYAGSGPVANDALLGTLVLAFSTRAPRGITVAVNGVTAWSRQDDRSLEVEINFTDRPVDAGSTVTVNLTQAADPCIVDVTLNVLIGQAALGGNPILGEGTDYIGQVGIEASDGPAGDAFSRLRVSEIASQLEVMHHSLIQARIKMGETADTTGTITHLPAESAVRLDTNPGEIVKWRSHQYVPYQPGKSRLIRLTGFLGTPVSDCIYFSGYGDDNDGAFFFLDQLGVGVILRSSTIGDRIIRQSDWNIDRFDGTGPSGLTLSPTTAIHLVFDLQWLAVGRVRWGIDRGGKIHYVHQFESTADLTVDRAYMRTGALPVSWELHNASASESASFKAICAAVASEGGHEPGGLTVAASTGATPKSVSGGGAVVPVLSIRPRDTFDGAVNRSVITPREFQVQAGDNVLIEARVEATLTGASWSPAAAESRVEVDTSATAVSGGRVVGSTYVTGGQGSRSGSLAATISRDLQLLRKADDSLRTLTLVARRLGSNTDVFAAINWLEVT
jgi:hypothetical protein